MIDNKKLFSIVDNLADVIAQANDEVWQAAEVYFKEYKSAQVLSEAAEKLKKGKRVAVKGRIAERVIEHEDGSSTHTFDLIGDKLMVLDEYDTQIEG